MRKTAEIKAIVEPDTKKQIKLKAEELGLSLTAFIEKVAHEPIVFLDKNTKALLQALQLKT